MGYSAEVLARARARLAEEKEKRESEQRRKLAEAYEKVPRLRQIDVQLRQTMATAAKAAFAGGDAVALMAQAKEENQRLQEERAKLVEDHFLPGYLDEAPICPHCGGNGYVGSTMCRCLMELCRREQQKELSDLCGGNEGFAQFRLDYYPDRVDPTMGANIRKLMERNLNYCRQYADRFAPEAGNLLFVGGTGLGKTFLSACIARSVADRGFSVVYETASRLFSKLEQARFSGDETARRETQQYQSCDLLILDDLGTEMPGQFVTAALYTLVNERLLAGKSMIVTTNLNVDEMGRRYSPQIASRLYGGFNLLPFAGEDIRVLKSRGRL